MINRFGERTLLIELENTNDSMINMSASDITINGLIVSSTPWSSDTINAGKRCIIDVNLSSALKSDYWAYMESKKLALFRFL